MEEDTVGASAGGLERAAYGFLAKRTELPSPWLHNINPIFESTLKTLKTRLLAQNIAEGDVDLCDEVFKDGVTIEALETRLTRSQCEKLGLRDGKRYQILLEVEGTGESGTRHRCRLCPRNDAVLYKNHRSALRHLRKVHLGLLLACEYW